MPNLARVAMLAILLATLAPRQAMAEPAPGGAPDLNIPAACNPGKNCWVSKYVDIDPRAAEMRDHACGRLADDGHKGIDFAVRDEVAMQAGIPILAAAAGTVKGVRDGMPDRNVTETGLAAVKDRECGNGMVLSHGGGWETQYCHLRLGSVRVRTGQEVKAGDVLGLMGMSGATEYPHVHFEVRHDGRIVDPFLGAYVPRAGEPESGAPTCGAAETPLWSKAALGKLAYRLVALYNLGFAAAPPVVGEVRKGTYRGAAITTDTPTMHAWFEVLGTMKGDRMSMRLIRPDGKVHQGVLEADSPMLLRLVSFKVDRPGTAWPAGSYAFEVSVSRQGADSVNARTDMTLSGAMADATPATAPQWAWAPVRLPAVGTGTANLAPSELFERATASVWQVLVAKGEQQVKTFKVVATGSAVAISENTLLTNCHVVAKGDVVVVKHGTVVDKVRVTAGKTAVDQCILETGKAELKPIAGIRSYQSLKVGEAVYTIGSPSGLENTLGEGIVSGLRDRKGQKLIQTTAQIAPGSSGGGLFDRHGNLIGITTFMLADGKGSLNFAIAAEEFARP